MKEACTSCGACVSACPEAILLPGPGRTPMVDFSRDGCSFCGACAEACEAPVFRPVTEAPWALTAHIGAGCLLDQGVSCRSCTDACDARALRYDLRAGAVGAVRVEDSCTGCGACVGMCPVQAISITDPGRARA